jgi:phosphate-selective porin OprO/OprP
MRRQIFATTALCALVTTTAAHAAADLNAIDARLRALEAEIVKLRKEAKVAKAQAAAAEASAKATNVANAAKAPPADQHAPPPVFVDVRKGLYVESEDKNFAFKVGGRLFVDGGGTAGPVGNGWQGNVGFGQARLEVEGKMKPWFYKMQYDFANSTVQLWNTNVSNAALDATNPYLKQSYVTDRNFLWGGWRDAYIGLQDPRLSAPWLAEPVYFKIGSQYESFSLEALASSKYRDTIERPLAVDAIAPFRHLGVAAGMIGKDNWTAHVGLYSLSFQDLNMRPVNTSSGEPSLYVPRYVGVGIPKTNWYQPWGGGAYWEATGRVTWAPILDEHRLVHIGVAGSYHQPNSSTAYSDDRNMAPGNRLGSEANVLGTTFLGTPDLSCGRFTPNPYINTSVFTTYNVSGNCIKDIEKLDLEAAFSYYNLFVQGEWLVANYNRNSSAAAGFAQAQLGVKSDDATGAWSLRTPAEGLYLSPANARYVASGGYIQGEWWITGEEKSQSYDMKDKNGVTFGQLKIKEPFSMGGWGAWGLVGRWSVLNLNNGPFQGATLNNLLLAAGQVPNKATAEQISQAYLTQNAIANSGIYGGYQANVTGGVNWYPDNGVAFQFNATHVLNLKSPLNANPLAAYESGSHPTFLEMRAKVYF